MQTLLRLYLVLGALLVVVAIPLILKKVQPNWLYGFRVPKTLQNPDIWYKANAYSGKWLLVAGVATLIATPLLYRIPGLSLDAFALLCAGVTLGLLSVGVAMSFRYLRGL